MAWALLSPGAMRLALILFAGLTLAGCFTTRQIAPATLGPATVDRSATLSLDLPEGRVGGRFSTLGVRDGIFSGQTVDGRTVTAPVAQIRSAEVRQTNVPGTIFLVVMGVAVIAMGAVLYEQTTRETAVPGRALRIGRAVVVAPPTTAGAGNAWQANAPMPDTSRMPGAAREILAVFWAENARAEHASVPAFSRLSLTLISLGAPAQLVEAAHRAALQEIDHARRTFALAAGYGDRAIAPGPLPELAGAPAVTAATLEELASESLVDGCFLEGVAAAVAADAVSRVQDESVLEVMRVIARDEHEHAELAWSVVRWCCAVGGPGLARHVRALAERLPEVADPRDAPAALHGVLAAHGWHGPDTWRRVVRNTRLEVAARAASLSGFSAELSRTANA